MGSKNVTLKDIADKAEVSITTVSHVINNTRYVKKETREAVLKALSDLNYTIDKPKSAEKKAALIGLIVANILEDYFISVIKVIETYASEQNISLLICDSGNNFEIERKNIQMLLEHNSDGIILAPVNSEKYPEELTATSIPVVLIDRQYTNHKNIFVGINNFRSGFIATRKLISKGCKNIGFIGYYDSIYTIRERSMGYISCLMELNTNQKIPYQLQLHYDKEDSNTLICDFIRNNKLDGLLCATSDLCYQVISSLKESDENMLLNIKIITYDDNKWLDYLRYPVSVITQPTAEISIYAVEKLVQMISDCSCEKKTGTEVFFDTDYIDRL